VIEWCDWVGIRKPFGVSLCVDLLASRVLM